MEPIQASLSTINVWLAILALISVAELAALVGAAIVGVRMYRRAAHAMSEIETRHVAPLSARVNALLDDLDDVTARVRQADDNMRTAINVVQRTVDRAASTL